MILLIASFPPKIHMVEKKKGKEGGGGGKLESKQ